MTQPVFRPTVQTTLQDLVKRVRALEAVISGGFSQIEFLAGNPVNLPTDGSSVLLEWAHVSGSALLDTSVPTLPTIVTAGDYVVAAWASCTAPDAAGGSFEGVLDFDIGGAGIRQAATAPMDGDIRGNPGFFLAPEVQLGAPYSFEAGMALGVLAAQGSGNAHQGELAAIVMKLPSRSITP